jgi:hypothetical protein
VRYYDGMMPRLLSLLSAGFATAVAVTNGLHPLLHALEGGSLDAALGYLNAVAAQLTATRCPR